VLTELRLPLHPQQHHQLPSRLIWRPFLLLLVVLPLPAPSWQACLLNQRLPLALPQRKLVCAAIKLMAAAGWLRRAAVPTYHLPLSQLPPLPQAAPQVLQRLLASHQQRLPLRA
jgi:hypothetical protein